MRLWGLMSPGGETGDPIWGHKSLGSYITVFGIIFHGIGKYCSAEFKRTRDASSDNTDRVITVQK